jgi:hypothetical protein
VNRPGKWFSAALAWAALSASTAANSERHALLVGVSEYPTLAAERSLAGPANDVANLQHVLRANGFAEANVQVLADKVPGARFLPTRAAILSALDQLAATAKSGDYVFLYLAGHGSRQPAPPGAKDEPDGLDEIFLPRDIGKWDGKTGSVANALVDNELDQRIAEIRRKGAFVWAVMDSCHSATATRSTPAASVKYRQVAPEELGIAPQVSAGKPADAEVHAPGQGSDAALPGGFVGFYAAQTTEEAPEMPLPAGASARPGDAKPMGLFTFSIASALTRYPGLTYRQLAQVVLQEYGSYPGIRVTPAFEGAAIDARVFDREGGSAVPQWPIELQRGQITIPAGRIAQLGEGAVFAILAGPAEDRVLGYALAKQLENFRAVLQPISMDDLPALGAESIKKGYYARLKDPNLTLSLRVAVPGSLARPCKSAAAGAAREVIDVLRKKPPEGLRVQWTDAGQPADVRLDICHDRLWFAPPSGEIADATSAGSASPQESRTYSIPLVDVTPKVLEDALRRIARATNLVRLTSQFGLPSSEAPLRTSVTVTRSDTPAKPLALAPMPQLKAGDEVALALHNAGRMAIDVTVLFIDSAYGITSFFPVQGQLNRLEPGARETVSFTINADTVGVERVVLIAAEATPGAVHADYSYLEQARLPARATRSGAARALDEMLNAAAYGTMRGADRPVPKGYVGMSSFSWRTVP